MIEKDREISINFGANLAKIRMHQGLTQDELAFRCKLQRSYIGAIERGEKNITLCTLYKISAGLNIEPYKLLKYASQ